MRAPTLLIAGSIAFAACIPADPDFDCEAEDAAWPAAQAQAEEAMRAEIDRVRSEGASCRGWALDPAPAVTMDADLRCAARAHSRWMAEGGFLSSTSPGGSEPWDRVERVGYAWRVVAENVAAGDPDPEATVASMLASEEGHCENLMNPETTEVGIGAWEDADSEHGFYWTLLFAAPR